MHSTDPAIIFRNIRVFLTDGIHLFFSISTDNSDKYKIKTIVEDSTPILIFVENKGVSWFSLVSDDYFRLG